MRRESAGTLAVTATGGHRLSFAVTACAAIVQRGGSKPGTLHMHADHLGSVDVVTDA